MQRPSVDLPQPGLADEAERLALRDRQVDPVDGAQHLGRQPAQPPGGAAAQREVHLEAADVEQRLGRRAIAAVSHRRSPARGARRPRRPRGAGSASRGRRRARRSGNRVARGSRPGRTPQRGWKRQPGGGEARSGGVPGIDESRVADDVEVGHRAQQAERVRMARLAEDARRPSPVSTIWPAYITATRRQVCAITARSCETKTRLTPSSSCSARRSLRIWSWIVTSSAVVGSSQRISFGSAESAIAIITRCRMPPESSCG